MTDWTRPTAVAGTFYPKDAAGLRGQLAEFCSPPSVPPGDSFAIMAPHAGYRYSGRIAGEIYRRVKVPDLAIVLCPNHTGYGRRISIWGKGAWKTPLGDVSVDSEVASQLLDLFGESEMDQAAHLGEHAIEVQLPFLQFRNPNVKIVPVVLGPLSQEVSVRIGEALAALTAKFSTGQVLLVASTDMSHYIAAKEAKVLDDMALNKIKMVDALGLYQTVAQNNISMCGFIPTTCVLAAAAKSGIRASEIIAYGDSGDVTGDKTSVVAYASANFALES